jgi:hypothetical protein
MEVPFVHSRPRTTSRGGECGAVYRIFPLLPLSEFELHEVTDESLVVAISDPPVSRHDVCNNARTWDRVAKLVTKVNGTLMARRSWAALQTWLLTAGPVYLVYARRLT